MNGYIQLWRGLKTHLKTGSMTLEELSVYVYLQFIADFRKGVCFTSAPHIHYDTHQTMTIRKIQRILESLAKKRYINRFIVDGRKGDYHILIHKYAPTDGVWTGKYLNAWKSESSEALVFEDRVDDDVDSDVDDDARDDVRTGEYVKKSVKKSKTIPEEVSQEKQAVVASARTSAEQEGTGDALTECLNLWYQTRLSKELSSVSPDKIQRDLPLMEEISREVGLENPMPFLLWVLTNEATEKFSGWNAVTPSLQKLREYMSEGTILVQYNDYRKELAAYEEKLRGEEEAAAAASEAAKAQAKRDLQLRKEYEAAHTCKHCKKVDDSAGRFGYCRDCNEHDPDEGHHFVGCRCESCGEYRKRPEVQERYARLL